MGGANPEMTSRPDVIRLSVRGLITCAAAIAVLGACETSEPSGPCAQVEKRHLAVQRGGGSTTRICNPQRVSPAYREQYFPGYVWGDETWTVTP